MPDMGFSADPDEMKCWIAGGHTFRRGNCRRPRSRRRYRAARKNQCGICRRSAGCGRSGTRPARLQIRSRHLRHSATRRADRRQARGARSAIAITRTCLRQAMRSAHNTSRSAGRPHSDMTDAARAGSSSAGDSERRVGPTLAIVMAASLAVSMPGSGCTAARRRCSPTLAAWPTRKDIERPLIAGATLIGIGWGLSGLLRPGTCNHREVAGWSCNSSTR